MHSVLRANALLPTALATFGTLALWEDFEHQAVQHSETPSNLLLSLDKPYLPHVRPARQLWLEKRCQDQRLR